MLKYRITNVSGQDGKGGHPKFVIEAGTLLQPGEAIPVSRVDKGTYLDKEFQIEEGEFERMPPTVVKKPVVVDDDDDDEGVPSVDEKGPGVLVTASSKKKSVPLVATTSSVPGPAATTRADTTATGDDLSKDDLDKDILPAKTTSGPGSLSDAKTVPGTLADPKSTRKKDERG